MKIVKKLICASAVIAFTGFSFSGVAGAEEEKKETAGGPGPDAVTRQMLEGESLPLDEMKNLSHLDVMGERLAGPRVSADTADSGKDSR